jgi:hypothetical protein
MPPAAEVHGGAQRGEVRAQHLRYVFFVQRREMDAPCLDQPLLDRAAADQDPDRPVKHVPHCRHVSHRV